MSLRCLFGYHRPSQASIMRRQTRYAALCQSCARPLERGSESRWIASDPLYEAKGRSTG